MRDNRIVSLLEQVVSSTKTLSVVIDKDGALTVDGKKAGSVADDGKAGWHGKVDVGQSKFNVLVVVRNSADKKDDDDEEVSEAIQMWTNNPVVADITSEIVAGKWQGTPQAKAKVNTMIKPLADIEKLESLKDFRALIDFLGKFDAAKLKAGGEFAGLKGKLQELYEHAKHTLENYDLMYRNLDKFSKMFK